MFRLIASITFAVAIAAAETTIPKEAVETEPGVYKHTEASGKTFLYRKTPFGVVKSPEKDPAKTRESAAVEAPKAEPGVTPFGKVNAPAKPETVKVVDRGDFVEFERPSPFGVYRWKRAKNEMNAEERAQYERARASSTTGPKE